MAKQLNVDMRFTADTSKAKQAINDLEQSLQKLGHSTMPANAGIDPAQFEKASAAARELEFHLKNAYNAKTGNLDLSKLQSSLQSSRTNLKQLTSGFSQAGAVGQQAFVNVARAIASADQPSLVLNTHLATMWTTLKNVARFQISSSIMHGLIGGVQQAYGYAQDLNKSLNNIRIVTGASTAEMARFAEQANKSARALSTTTLDYTDAALIYYQQGIRDQEEIASRVETTVKLANVSHQSAEEVSDQMTAIWNNFYDGSQSLEYYADVITALGAATASSSQEIAGGLEKFASVAQTVGLSYEYAASALATIVAQTRQSEDTVGTGLRTLFARFEGLKLGETLEDGVDLNKYSKALQTIGVNVLDANGNLREMDDILDDMGEKWDTLTQAQKVALAQTVGGVRQYTNLIALMDNWDKFQENLATAQGAEGALQQQAEIYAQSWEAARTRVKTAMQSIYAALIDEDFFIGVDNTIEHMLNGISAFIKEFGGVKSILTAVLSFAAVMLADRIGPAVQKIIQDIKILSGGAGKIYSNMQKDMSNLINYEKTKKQTNASGQMITASGQITTDKNEAIDLYSTGQQAELTGAQQLLVVKTKLSAVNDKLNATERMRAEIAMSGIQSQIKANGDLAKEIDKVKQKILDLTKEEKKAREDKLAEKKTELTKKQSDLTDNVVGAKGYDSYQTLLSKQNSFVAQNRLGDQARIIKQGNEEVSLTVRQSLQASLDSAKGIGTELYKIIINEYMKGIDSGELGKATTAIKDQIKASLQSLADNPNDLFGTNIVNSQGIVEATSANFDIAQANLEIYKSQFSELINLCPELGTAFEAAINATDAEEFNAKAQNLLKILKGDLGEITGQAEDFMRVIGVPQTKIQEFVNLKQEIKELNSNLGELDDNQLEQVFKTIATGAQQGKDLDAITKDIDKLMDRLGKGKMSPQLTNQIKDLIKKMLELENGTKRVEKRISSFNPKPKITGIQTITSFAGALGQVSTALRAITSLTETWNNQDLTFGEKLTSSFMSISMLIPSVMSSFSGFSTVMHGINDVLGGQTAAWGLNAQAALANADAKLTVSAAEAASTTASELKTAAVGREVTTLGLSEAATKLAAAADWEKVTSDKAVIAAIETGDPARVKEAAMKVLSAHGSTEEAKAEVAEAFAKMTTKKATEMSIGAKIKHIAIMLAEKAVALASNPVYLALALAIGAVVLVMRALHKASEQRKKDAEAAAEATKKEIESAKKLKEEQNELIDLLKNYTNLYDKYKEVGEGKKDLEEQARKLIDVMQLENGELLIQAGLYDEILQKGKDYAAQQAIQTNVAALSAVDTAGESIQSSINESTEGGSFSQGYIGETDTDNNNHFRLVIKYGSKDNEASMPEILNELATNDEYKNQGLKLTWMKDGYLYISVPDSGAGMDLLRDFSNKALEEGEKGGDLYTGLSNFITQQSDVYSELDAALELANNNDYAAGIVLDKEINSYNDYVQAANDITNQLQSAYGEFLTPEQIVNIRDNYLRQNESTADYWAMDYAMMNAYGVSTQPKLNDLSDRSEFMRKWDLWSPKEKELVFKIIKEADGEPITLEDIENGLDQRQDEILQYEQDRLDDLIQLIDSNAKDEELLNFYKNNSDLFNELGINSSSMLFSMGRDELRRIASQGKQELQQQRAIPYNQKITDLQQQWDSASAAYYEAEKRQDMPSIIEGRQLVLNSALTHTVAFPELQTQRSTLIGNYTDDQLANISDILFILQAIKTYEEHKDDGEIDSSYLYDILHTFGFETIDDFKESNWYQTYDALIRSNTNNQKSIDTVDTTSFGTAGEDGDPWLAIARSNRNNFISNLTGGYSYPLTIKDIDSLRESISEDSSSETNNTENNEEDIKDLETQLTSLRNSQYLINTVETVDKLTGDEWLEDFKTKITNEGFNFDEITQYANFLRDTNIITQEINESTEKFIQRSLELANAQKLLEKGLTNLTNDFEEYYTLLNNGETRTENYSKALKKMQNNMMDFIGATGEKQFDGTIFDEKFFEDNQEIIEKATEGDIEAIEALQTAAAEQIIIGLEISDNAKEQLLGDNGIINQMQALIPDDLAIGVSIETLGLDNYINMLNQMLQSGELTADQVNAILKTIGFDPEIDFEEIVLENTSKEEVLSEGGVNVQGQHYAVSADRLLETDGQVILKVPKINSKKTTSTGAPRIGGTKSNGGGGGGGKQSVKEKKDPTDERDRYHTITQKIQDATDAYDELSKAEDRAFGKERIKAMEGITNNLKLQIELQKQYLDEIRNYLEGDRAAVEALGATFDANGVITNYDDLIAELVAKYNEGVDAFNNGGLDEDAFKEQYEEPFNDAKEAIDQYVETINLLQSEELNLIDLQNDLADQFREIAAYKLELHIDIDEDELKYLDFLLEMLGENAEDAVDRLDLLGQQFNTNRDEIAAYTTAIQDLLRLRGFTDEDVAAFIRGELTASDLEERGFTTDDIDKLREYRDAIQDNTTAMNDLAKEIEESFLNTLDDLNEKVDDAEERFEHFATMLEHFHNVVDIVGQDALGMSAETMKLLAKAAKENAIEMVKAAKTQLDSLNAVRAQAQAQLDAALEAQKNASTAEEKLRAEEAVRYWSDTISEVTNRVEQAEEDLADALENALEGIQEMYTTMIEQATKEFEHSVTGAAGSLEQLQNNFDRQKEIQELYIPTYEKIYELTKLTRDINNSIDDTDNLWSKQELAKLQDEINQKMEDGVELTEHDVEELRKRYELKLAEAALEEAQDAKRTVRMSRDNEGNWSYVYTADENDVAAAEQSYEDKLYEYQQMNYEYIQELQGNIIQAEQDMTDQINDLDVTKFASKEAYLAEVQRIMDATQAKEQQYKDQLAQTLDQQGILYEEDWKRYNELTGYRMARDDQWVDNWNETILAQQTGFETLEEMFDQLTDAIGSPEESGTYVGDITDAYAEMQASNERALNAAGTSMQTYEQDTVDAISGIDQQMEETQNQVDEFTNSMAEAMEGVSDFIGEWKNQYGEAVKSITEFNKDLYDSCNTLIKKLQDTYGVNADFEAAQAQAAAEALAGSNRGGSNGGDIISTPSPDSGLPPKTGDNAGPKKYDRIGSGDGPDHEHAYTIIHTYDDGTEKYRETDKEKTAISGGAGMVCPICGKMWAKDYRKTNTWIGLKSGGYTGTWSVASARTGMYTGSWNGPDLEENGRLAFLHQKELVLNASDTENFLSAVDMVRQISQTIDLQAASRSNGWNFLLPGILDKKPNTLDQNVHIEAHFPNVTSHSEIEEAFTNLVGKASQFANR